jgi:hypothetical protein
MVETQILNAKASPTSPYLNYFPSSATVDNVPPYACMNPTSSSTYTHGGHMHVPPGSSESTQYRST